MKKKKDFILYILLILSKSFSFCFLCVLAALRENRFVDFSGLRGFA